MPKSLTSRKLVTLAGICAVAGAILAMSLTAPGSDAAAGQRYMVVSVAGKMSAFVNAGYAMGSCANGTPSLFTGDIHGRRPGRPVGRKTEFGTVYNDLFRADVKSSRGSFSPATGKGNIFARIRMPYVSGGTGERIGCGGGDDYGICEDRFDAAVMTMAISLRKIGTGRAGMFWNPGGETASPRDPIAPLNAAGLTPLYECRDTYFPFVKTAPRGKGVCTNRAPAKATLARDVFVLRLKCSFDRSEYHPYDDGDGKRNVADRASIVANVKVRRVD